MKLLMVARLILLIALGVLLIAALGRTILLGASPGSRWSTLIPVVIMLGIIQMALHRRRGK